MLKLAKTILQILFPSTSYKGTTKTLIKLYNMCKNKGNLSEQDALNHIISERINVSLGEERLAKSSYGHLLNNNNKTLTNVIKAIIAYEYFESPDSELLIKETISSDESLEQVKKKYMDYIDKACSQNKKRFQ